MCHDLLSVGLSGTEPGLRFLVHQLREDIPGVIAQEWEVELGVILSYLFEQLLFVLTVEWGLTAQHLVDNGAEGPPV